MRNMSFWLTTPQMRAKTKTVTRRFGWAFLKDGERVCAVVKGMGLKKGKKVERIYAIDIVSTRWEPLNAITKAECIKEGFPDMEPAEFVAMMCQYHGCKSNEEVNRIEFEYVE